MLLVFITIAQAAMVGLILKNQRRNVPLLIWAVGFLAYDVYLLTQAG